MDKKISIILSTYNEALVIEQTISEIFKYVKNVEIILVDDNSPDGTFEKVNKINNPNLKVFSKKFSNETIQNFKSKQALIIEDLDENFSENLLYTVLNIIEQENKYLLITSLEPLNKFNFKLPDLISRIRNCLIIGIKNPDDNLIFALLIKYLSDRQINIDKKLIEYIIKRIDRSYEKIFLFIHKIDKLSLKKGKPINLATIKEALEK